MHTPPRPLTVGLALASLALVAPLGSPFTITFRLGGHVIGPEWAVAVVLPTTEAVPGARLAGATEPEAPASSRVAEIWVTMRATPATERLAQLADATAGGHPTIGHCDIAVTTADGRVVRRYAVGGCYAKRVDAVGGDRRVTLGYATITQS